MGRGTSLRPMILALMVMIAAIVALSITRRAAVYANGLASTRGENGRMAGLAVWAGFLGIILLGLIVRG